MSMLRVVVNGAFGRMGFLTHKTLGAADPKIEVIAGLGKQHDLAAILQELEPDVVIDFTTPETVLRNTEIIINANIRAVIGTSGLTEEQIQYFATQCRQKQLGTIIAPNFCLSAILMMRYAKDASQYFPQAEIIDIHHEKKIDAPSATAIKTADLMHATRVENENVAQKAPLGMDSPARGHLYKNTPIHSIRLPGHFAHQVIMFGAEHQTLTLRYDSYNRESMIPGVALACKKVMELDGLVYGLENII